MADEAKYPRQFGPYLLLRKLAQGGMAEIFLAKAPDGSICALKRILPHLATEENFIRMFIDEARIVSHLRHPNVAAVREQGKEKNYYYIAMEFVQGHSLLALSERAKSTRMDLPRGLLAYVGAELLAGLGSAHAARDRKGRHLGIVHRDVTPQNVLISYDGQVKLIDFGVAKAKSRLTKTEAGFTKGKLAYMSPEQARGDELDGRSDLFSVGIILHEITTNARLFDREGPGGVLGAIVNDPIPTPSSKVRRFPKELERIIMKALEKDARRRYQLAEAMREDLLRYGRKERPQPSAKRLSELVHDLFGPPEDQGAIDEAVDRPGTPSVIAPKPRDETRMLSQDAVVHIGRSVQIVSTRDRAPIFDAPAEPEVPKPLLPRVVVAVQFLRELEDDFRLSYAEHRKRWNLAGLVVGVLLMVGFLAAIWPSSPPSKDPDKKAQAQALQPKRPQLKLVSEPPGALISFDGLGTGAVTPHIVDDFPLGRPVKVQLSLAGYRSVEEQILLSSKSGLRTERFMLDKKTGRLEISTEPSGAVVRIEGKRIPGLTPISLADLDAEQPLTVVLSKAGYESHKQVILLVDGTTLKLDERLKKKVTAASRMGSLRIESRPSGCEVIVEGAERGLTPVHDLKLEAGLYEVEVRCPHHAPELRYATVSSKATESVFVEARPVAFGYVTIEPIPSAGSTVTINGREVKTPVKFLKVVPGRHDVVVKNRRLNAERRFTLRVKPDDRVSRQVSLTF